MVLFAVGVEGSSVAEFGLGEWRERERERDRTCCVTICCSVVHQLFSMLTAIRHLMLLSLLSNSTTRSLIRYVHTVRLVHIMSLDLV